MLSSGVIEYADILRRLRRSGDGVALVAVDGPAGSGKSTFAERLAAVCERATVVEVDDFFSWTDLESWWPRLVAEALEPLLQGRAARFQARAWTKDPLGASLGPWKELAPAPYVIVEGVGASRRQAASLLALSIWVDAPAKVRLERGVARDGEAMRQQWVTFKALEDSFFRADGAKSRADLWVDGAPTQHHDPITQFIGAWSTTDN